MSHYRVECDCGYSATVKEGSLMKSADLEKSAHTRKAGHISASECELEDIVVEEVNDE